jgi:hypothetical protein
MLAHHGRVGSPRCQERTAMLGTIGQVIKFASMGAPTAEQMVRSVFGPGFQTPQGWAEFLDRNIPARQVEMLFKRTPGFWNRESFQALYVACWIFHPVEKGSYMVQLGPHARNVRDAYNRLLDSRELQARISSHLSKAGASAHEGWDFLQGYRELLVQIEGEASGTPYLFLKCEGHPLDGAMSTLKHGMSWLVKSMTGAGQTASPALNNLAMNSTSVELRAAENFSKSFKKVQKKLGLSGKEVTMGEVVDGLWKKCGFPNSLPAHVTADTHSLGKAMLGPTGIIAVCQKQKPALKKAGIDFSADLAKELTELAERMTATSVAHPQQHYHEVRCTPADLTQALASFSTFIR